MNRNYALQLWLAGFICGFGIGLLMAVGLLSAAQANASVTDTPARICAELRGGHPLIDLFHDMTGAGQYQAHDAGVAVGSAVVNRCPDQKESALAQAVILEQLGI